MHARKWIIYFILFVLTVILVHLTVQYSNSLHINNFVINGNIDYVNRNYSDNNKYIGLPNAFTISCHDNVSVVVLVLCKAGDKELRNIIRHTWGQWISSEYKHNIPSNVLRANYHSQMIKLLFVVGSDATDKNGIRTELTSLGNENRANDIMYFPELRDSYMNLTLKTLNSVNSAMRSCPGVTFFLKADSDVFLNIPLLVDFCNKYFDDAQRRPLIFGNEQVRATVIRDESSKWYIPRSKHYNDYFPNYVTGCGYILNRLAIINIMSTASQVNELFEWEDVAVTGMYSVNVTIVDTKMFRYESYMQSIGSCFMKTIILAHRISASKMTSLWNDMVTNKVVCSSLGLFDTMIRSWASG